MNRENLERSTRHIRRAGERLRGLLERSHRRRRWESAAKLQRVIRSTISTKTKSCGPVVYKAVRHACPSRPLRRSTTGSSGWVSVGRTGFPMRRWCVSGPAWRRSSRNVSCTWLDSAGRTSPSSWLDGRSSGMLFSCLMKRCAFSGAIFLLPGGFSQDCSNRRMSLCSRLRRCGRHSSTPFATEITADPMVRFASLFTATVWKYGVMELCRSGSFPRI